MFTKVDSSGPFGGATGAASTSISFDFFKPIWNAAPDLDPNDIVDGNAVISDPGKLSISVKNPATVSYTPGTGARWVVPLQTMDGVVDPNIVIGDILRSLARAGDALDIGMADNIHASDAGHAAVVAELATRWR